MSLLACIWLSGCENNTSDNEEVKITKDYIPMTDIVESRPDVYVIVKSMNSSYWDVVIQGTKQAGLDMDCNIYVEGSNLETEWKLQEEYIKLAMERGADAIILGPDNTVRLSDAVDMVHAAGIPIIIVDTIVNSQNYDVCYMTDNLLAGEAAAKEMLRLLHAKGYADEDKVTVAIELGAKASQTINERLAGFCQYWTKYAPAVWSLIDEIKCNDGDEEYAVTVSTEVLKEHPDICGVFGTDNASTMGFSSALMETDMDDVILVGFDYSPEAAALIEENKVDVAIVLQRQYDMGYLGVKSALELINGGENSLKFIDTGVAVLNRDNFDTKEIQDIISNNQGE